MLYYYFGRIEGAVNIFFYILFPYFEPVGKDFIELTINQFLR
jgi:hypothetical protein